MRTALCIALVSLISLFLPTAQPVAQMPQLASHTAQAHKQESSVYICTGPHSVCYHRTSRCRGLNNCSRAVITCSKEKVKREGRRACRICYR